MSFSPQAWILASLSHICVNISRGSGCVIMADAGRGRGPGRSRGRGRVPAISRPFNGHQNAQNPQNANNAQSESSFPAQSSGFPVPSQAWNQVRKWSTRRMRLQKTEENWYSTSCLHENCWMEKTSQRRSLLENTVADCTQFPFI